jgi:hypothetical protein
VGQTEYQMAEATIGALANLATATANDRVVVATLTEVKWPASSWMILHSKIAYQVKQSGKS